MQISALNLKKKNAKMLICSLMYAFCRVNMIMWYEIWLDLLNLAITHNWKKKYSMSTSNISKTFVQSP